jgi:peptidoglycan/LPS O-acetylase OafA/YrhL
LQFRKDINGLRAFAVIAVVLFHFNPNWLPGGFAGVDVFFVISGFLMTGIIFRGIDNGNFSILRFYIARANRIIPALAVLCFALLIFGWFYLAPLDYKALSKHAVGSISFLSNIIFYREAGYFDAASHSKWLLHTWSLSVEWQFYIIYPLVLVAMRKFIPINIIKSIVLLGTALGFAFCVIATSKWPDLSYYFLPTRAWEMMLGGVAFLYPLKLKEINKTTLETFGLLLIVGSYFFISEENLWPGYLAIFPCLGAFFIIQAQRANSKITGNIVFQKIGDWSYSIYLWHWPFVVGIYYFSLSDIWVLPGILISIFLGFLSNKYIEKIKFKNNFDTILNYLKCKPLYFIIIIGLIGSFIYVNHGLDKRFNNNVMQELVDARTDILTNRGDYLQGSVKSHGQGEYKINLLGDSHAASTLSALSNAIDGKVKFYGLGNCPTTSNLPKHSICRKFNDWAFEEIIQNNNPLIIINSSAYAVGSDYLSDPKTEMKPMVSFDNSTGHFLNDYSSNTKDLICQYSKKIDVYWVRPYARMEHDYLSKLIKSKLNKVDYGLSLQIDLEQHNQSNSFIHKIQNEVKSDCNVKILDPIPYLCEEETCRTSKNDTILYYDSNHLTEAGNKLLVPMFKSALKKEPEPL